MFKDVNKMSWVDLHRFQNVFCNEDDWNLRRNGRALHPHQLDKLQKVFKILSKG